MMSSEKRLIDAHDLWSDIMMLPHNGDMISSEEVEQAIKDAPTVDAEEVVHGHWMPQVLLGQRVWDCSECKTLGSPHWKRCPVCEAKMDGERKDND